MASIGVPTLSPWSSFPFNQMEFIFVKSSHRFFLQHCLDKIDRPNTRRSCLFVGYLLWFRICIASMMYDETMLYFRKIYFQEIATIMDDCSDMPSWIQCIMLLSETIRHSRCLLISKIWSNLFTPAGRLLIQGQDFCLFLSDGTHNAKNVTINVFLVSVRGFCI